MSNNGFAPTSSKVAVNGKIIEFDAYNIGQSNYFKLRDIAYALNGTQKSFEIGWNSKKNAISLTVGEAYTPIGGEMAAKDLDVINPMPTTAKILLDGEEFYLEAYIIGELNYIKLRDIGKALGFRVDWDAVSETITIDTEAK